MRLPQRSSKAFTLIELIVVIVILGILALIAIPTFSKVIAKSQDESALSSLRAMARNAQALKAMDQAAAWGSIPADSIGEVNTASAPGLRAAVLTAIVDDGKTNPTSGQVSYKVTGDNVVFSLLSGSKRICLVGATTSSVGLGKCVDSGKDTTGAVTTSSAASAWSSDASVVPASNQSAPVPSVTPAAKRADAIAATSPLWWYRLGDASGSTTAKAAAGGVDGVPQGSYTPGTSGSVQGLTSTTFGGSGYGRVRTPMFNPTGTGSYSMEAWVTPSVADGSFRPIFTNEASTSNGTDGRPRLQIAVYQNKYYCERVSDTSSAGVYGAALTAGVTSHVVCTYDGATLRIYVDGDLKGSTAASGNVSATTQSYIGSMNNAYAGFYWKGSIEDVAVHLRALTLAEITAQAQVK